MRPIDADALKKSLDDLDPFCHHCDGYGYLSTQKVEDTIDKAPTIEPPTWTSCAERLPTYNERVLAYDCGKIELLTLFYRDFLIEDYWEDDVGRAIRLGAVTHWMPLPQPPKEGE